jgi:hypothetical protein
MSNITPEHPVIYRGANVTFVKRMANLTQKQVYCNCVQEQYKKFVTAENNPQQSNALRISQLISASNGLGGKIIFGNKCSNQKSFIYKPININMLFIKKKELYFAIAYKIFSKNN